MVFSLQIWCNLLGGKVWSPAEGTITWGWATARSLIRLRTLPRLPQNIMRWTKIEVDRERGNKQGCSSSIYLKYRVYMYTILYTIQGAESILGANGTKNLSSWSSFLDIEEELPILRVRFRRRSKYEDGFHVLVQVRQLFTYFFRQIWFETSIFTSVHQDSGKRATPDIPGQMYGNCCQTKFRSRQLQPIQQKALNLTKEAN